MSQCVVVHRPCTEWDYGLNCIHVPHSFHILSLCPLTYLTLINCLHLCLSLATVLADARLFQPSFVRSCSVVLLHVVFGLSTFRVPSGCHIKGFVHILVISILRSWPIHPNFLYAILSLTFVVPILRRRFSFEIFSGHVHVV